MELEAALKQAAAIVEGADLPSDLRATAFAKAIDSLMGTSAVPSGLAGSSAGREKGPRAGGEMRAIADKIGLAEDVVSEVYDVKDGTLDVILPYSRIAKGAAPGARQLAVLVVAGRQAAGIDGDGWTAVAEIRAICKEFNRYDSANFASTVLEMGEWFSISGSGSVRRVKLTRAGWEHSTQLLDELTAR
jgi:hypothetical protein